MSTFLQPGPGGSSVAGPSNTTTEEYVVRAPQERKKKFCMMKFTTGTNLDFLKLTQNQVKMERENNLKEYKSAYDIDTMPKFGAGSEFGRDQKEEARRKKYGIRIKQYNPEDQPWLMKVGSGKQAKRYKGVREGTITDNTSYYIFTQCADGAFEAWPIEEWYNFSQMIKYKYLNSEEAEEEFNKRDKTLNLFSVMVRQRVRGNKDEDKDLDEEEKKLAKSKKKKKNKDFMLTEMEDWMDMSDDDDDDDDDDRDGSDDEKPKGKGKKDGDSKGKKNAKHNSDDEAVEESDEGDFDDREVDYMTDSSSISSDDDREKMDKYEEKGVDMESGLKKLIDSEESSEEEEKKEEEEEEEEEKTETKKDGSESDSSSSSSGSDSDIEKDEKFSALFMQKKSSEKKSSSRSGTPRSGTPTSVNGDPSKGKETKAEGVKRKMEEEVTSAKKMRTESPVMSTASSEDITEDSIRRYLTRKPMTAKELVQKFKSKKLHMSKEEMTSKIGKLLKKINPEKKYINQTMYLSLKKSE